MKDKELSKTEIKIHTKNCFKTDILLNWTMLIGYFLGSYYLFTIIYTALFQGMVSYYAVVYKFLIPFSLSGIVLLNCFYVTLYYFEIPFFEKYKVNDLEWPWKSNPEHFNKIIYGAIYTYLFNYFSFNLYLLLLGLWIQPEVDPNHLPTIPIYFIQILFAIVCEDFFFYWGHRLLHHPSIYAKVHKKHHEFYDVIHISCINTHWFEFLASNIFPLFSSLLILGKRMHIVTFIGWIFFRILETHECHSGYEFSWSMFSAIPFMNDSAYHNFHHLKNIGNYTSFFRLWDTLFGTNRYYYEINNVHI